MVRKLIVSGKSLGLGGTRREVTVLFTDVADFTAKTEKADPSQVMIFTSRYFATLSEAIMNHQGTIDKFIGDAVMALWNAPTDDPDHTVNACEAVLACVRKNEELNESFRNEGWPPYETRFGLHVGDAVVGNVGSSERMNYTALGATINLAARLEGLNKNYGTQVLASEAVKARAEHRFVFRHVDRISPKGFAEAVAVHELRCAREGDIAAELALCGRWDEVYRTIERKDPATALAAISAFLSEYPGDSVARYYAERVQAAVHSERPKGTGMGLRKRAR
jgi:adenylate cyclase